MFVGSRDGAIYGLDEASGERRWRVSHRGSWVIGSPAVDGERVYLGSSDGHFAQALDAEGKANAWVYTYRPDRVGSGYVQLWGYGATLERLPMIQAAAEYGLLRP